ncbi:MULTISPECIES: hypothetical protein [unclassified Brevibacterium]|uniref:hypothetical protein n=1 Tax=unclassified Brevibacterium TaxID=2614124 RepID=UPI001091DC72|nr:hypothetical protein [Brevibacterium sp. S22]
MNSSRSLVLGGLVAFVAAMVLYVLSLPAFISIVLVLVSGVLVALAIHRSPIAPESARKWVASGMALTVLLAAGLVWAGYFSPITAILDGMIPLLLGVATVVFVVIAAVKIYRSTGTKQI